MVWARAQAVAMAKYAEVSRIRLTITEAAKYLTRDGNIPGANEGIAAMKEMLLNVFSELWWERGLEPPKRVPREFGRGTLLRDDQD